MVVSEQTFRDGRRELLNTSSRYLQWAHQEPARRDFHMAHRKAKQRQLAQLRKAHRVVIMPGTAEWAKAMR
jgi:hypothetical protein